MTSHTKFNYKAVEIIEIEKINCKKSDRKNHRWRRRIKKKHNRTSPDVEFKEFLLTKQKTKVNWENHFQKIRSKHLKIKVKMSQVNKKPLARKGKLVQTK